MPFKNKEDRRKFDRERYSLRRDEELKRNEKWRLKNPSKVASRHAIYRSTHREEINKRSRNWKKNNPDMVKAQKSKRRARKSMAGGSFTAYEWNKKILEYAGRCAYCGDIENNPTQDHVIPISRGGSSKIDNIVPACKRCNSSKGSKTLQEWKSKWNQHSSKRLMH